MWKKASRPPPPKSKAGPTTQCQKCYQYGHYTYECKNERVYQSRPSRTKLLNNPNIQDRPKIEIPEEFLSKKGVADKILKQKQEERLKAALDEEDGDEVSLRNVRSPSISSRSISSPSPSLSPSPSSSRSSSRSPSKSPSSLPQRRRRRSSERSVSEDSYRGQRRNNPRSRSPSPRSSVYNQYNRHDSPTGRA